MAEICKKVLWDFLTQIFRTAQKHDKGTCCIYKALYSRFYSIMQLEMSYVTCLFYTKRNAKK